MREKGWGVEDAQAELGFFSPLTLGWDARRVARLGGGRHHLAVYQEVEDAFWRCFLAGEPLEAASRIAGVSRWTGYRWWQRRFLGLREQGVPVRVAARRLRVPSARATAWEAERREASERARREREAAERRAVRNHGPSAASAVALTDTWSTSVAGGVQLLSFVTTQGQCTLTNEQRIDCQLGGLASGATTTVTVTVRARGTGSVTDQARVSAAEFDPDTANNADSETTAVGSA